MAIVNQYRLFCITENVNVTCWRSEADGAPTVCPNNNTHTINTESICIIDSVKSNDVNIASTSSGVIVPSQDKGFQDLSGHNVFRFGELEYDIQAGETNIFCEKFNSTMYIQGGGVTIPEYIYVNGQEVVMKPEKGDYCVFDLVDIDAVTPYGKKATISKVARSNNIATVTTAAHTFVVGEKICVNANDDSFDDMEVVISSIPDNTHLTYANSGDDVSEKDATGLVGKVFVLVPFVPNDKCYPKKEWNIHEKDAKAIPAGIYLRFKYVSFGSTDLSLYVHYNLRT